MHSPTYWISSKQSDPYIETCSKNIAFNFTAVRYSLHKCSETIQCLKRQFIIHVSPASCVLEFMEATTRNSSGDEIANVNFLYDDIVHALGNTIDSSIKSAMHRSTQLEHRFTEFSEITQCNGHYAIQGHRFRYQSKAHIQFPISD